MGRAPCCDKMGLNKGPWSREEDQILVNYINNHGHPNWRALPKRAGLLRCGKSCRLRWTNYLRPDIKRGNFTREEEDAIINLHEMLGNRWSAIAARLPGRTDNEIKNVWHTHLKKRLPLPQNQQSHDRKRNPKPMEMELDNTSNSKSNQDAKQEQEDPVSFPTHHAIKAETESTEDGPLQSLPRHCSGDTSTLATSTTDKNEDNRSIITNANNHDVCINNNDNNSVESQENNNDLALDENFLSEVLWPNNSGETGDYPAIGADPRRQFPFPFSPPAVIEEGVRLATSPTSSMRDDSMDFWYDVYTRSEEYLMELLGL